MRGESHAKRPSPCRLTSFAGWTAQEHKNVHTYSQVAAWAFGPGAGIMTNALLTVSQVR